MIESVYLLYIEVEDKVRVQSVFATLKDAQVAEAKLVMQRAYIRVMPLKQS